MLWSKYIVVHIVCLATVLVNKCVHIKHIYISYKLLVKSPNIGNCPKLEVYYLAVNHTRAAAIPEMDERDHKSTTDQGQKEGRGCCAPIAGSWVPV